MKKYILSLLIAFFAGSLTQALGQTLKPPPPVNPSVPNIWKTIPDLDTGRHSAVSFVIGTKIYVVMGDTTSWFFRGRIVAATWVMDTATKTWSRVAPFPGKLRIGATGFAIGNKGYVGGGRNFMKPDSLSDSYEKAGKDTLIKPTYPTMWQRTDTIVTFTNAKGDSVLNDFWEYDPSLDKWTRKADIPGTVMGRAYPISFVLDGKGYVGLGYDNEKITGSVAPPVTKTIGPYIDSIKHTLKNPGPPPLYKIDTVLKQVKKLELDSIFTDDIEYKKDLWEYNPATDVWTQKTDFPGQPRAYASAFALYTKACVGLGKGDSIPNALYDDFYEYTPGTNTWKRIMDFPASKRYGAGAWGIGFLGYIINGNDGLDRKDFYEYNDISQNWDRLPNKPDSARSLAIAGMVGRMGYYGTGAGVKESYENIFTWLVDTNRISITSIPTGPFCGGQSVALDYKVPAGVNLNPGNEFTIQLSDSTGSFFYPLDATKIASTATSGTLNFIIPPAVLEGKNYRFRVVSSNPKMIGTGTLTSHVINQLPTASGPINSTVCLKAPATLTVNAAGTGLTYQWYKNGNPLSNTSNISGVTTNILEIKEADLADGGNYHAIVSGTCSPSATSQTATLTVQNIPPPNITLQPKSDTVCEGSTKTFTINATGNALNYRWIKGNKDTLRNSPFIIGANTNSLTLTPTRVTDSGWYKAIVIENCGSRTVSDSFHLSFYRNTLILEQPVNVDTVEFVNIGFKVTAQGKNLTYQWLKGTTQLSNGPKYDGVTSDTLTVKNLTMGDVGFYQVEVTGLCGTKQKSLLGLLEIDPMPVITEQPVNTSDCEKSTVYFSVKVDGANITYQWRKGGTPLANGGKISGADERTLVITGIDNSDDGSYDCEVSTGPYTKVISSAATLITKPIPPKPTVNSFGADFIQSSVTGDVYRWYHDNVFEPTLTAATVKVTKVGDYRVRVTKDGCISELSDPYFWFPTTSIFEANAGNINLYPNPATTRVDVEIPSEVTNGTIKVYDMLGKVVLQKQFEATGTYALDIAALREGVYVITVSTDINTYVGRLVKE